MANKWLRQMAKINPDALYPTGFESAIVGINGKKFVLSRVKIVNILMKRDKMKRSDAIEYHYFNIEGSHMGKYTPKYTEEV